MAKKKESKPVGPVVKAPPTLNGKIVKLVRLGKEVEGVLLLSTQGPSGDLSFQWKNDEGISCISAVTKDELKALESKTEKTSKDGK